MSDQTEATDRLRWVRIERRFDASPERIYRAWADPEEFTRWFPERIEGSLAVGTRSTLVWAKESAWWDVQVADPNRRLVVRWPWLPDDRLVTTLTIAIAPVGYGSRMTLEDGPFPIDEPGVLDAWAEALQGWAEAVTMLRAYLDFSVDLRSGAR